MSSGPINPSEVQDKKSSLIPDVVFESFNKLIAEGISTSGRATVKQDDVVKLIVANSNLTRNEIFDKGYLDVEHHYRKAGWKVEFDKPAYFETYGAFFVFSSKKARAKSSSNDDPDGD